MRMRFEPFEYIRRMRTTPLSALFVTLYFLLGPTLTQAQSAPTLQITAPAPGIVFAPGQTIPVIVSVTPNVPLNMIYVLGENPLGGATATQTGTGPFNFSLSVPKDIGFRSYSLSAYAVLGNVGEIKSLPVRISISNPSPAMSLTADRSIALSYVGAQLPLEVLSSFADGTIGQVAKSPEVTYTVTMPNVVTVSATGLVTAIGTGTTSIGVHFRGLTATVPVSVGKRINGDLNGDGRVDTFDLNILASYLNRLATGPNDARDLNRDGVISGLDLAILESLCTYPQCATSTGASLRIGAISANPNTLWPPNGEPVPVTISAPTSGGTSPVSCAIVWVASNEPIDSGGDWIITGNLTLNLVANRLGTGTGRIYTIGIECTDAQRNSVLQTVALTVPHDQGN